MGANQESALELNKEALGSGSSNGHQGDMRYSAVKSYPLISSR